MAEVLLETGAARQYGRALTHAELRAETNSFGRVVTVVGVPVPDIVHYAEHGQWNAKVAEWVTGNPAGLTDIGYRAVGVELTGHRLRDDDLVLIEVNGEVAWPALTAVTSDA